jgi:Uma2 family endonuclease
MALRHPAFIHEDLTHMPANGRRYELFEGELIVSPVPTTRHQASSMQLSGFLWHAEEAGIGRAFAAPTEVYFTRHNMVCPDLLFIRTEREHIITTSGIQGPPDLVIEILSPSTRQHDLGWKMTLYARYGVPHYWIVDTDARLILPHTLGDNGYVEQTPLRPGDTLSSPLFPGITMPVARVFR